MGDQEQATNESEDQYYKEKKKAIEYLTRPILKKIKKNNCPEHINQKVHDIIEGMVYSETLNGGVEKELKYLQTLVEFPWNEKKSQNQDLTIIKRRLQNHFKGHEDVVNYVLDYSAAASLLSDKLPGMRLCFIGFPGTGKTHIARSIALSIFEDNSSNNCLHISLAGAMDSSWLLGIPKHYHGSQPGRIVRGIIRSGFHNPVILLDEIDKATTRSGSSSHGSPAEALLSVTDPDHGDHFEDYFLEMPIDLRPVHIIATANDANEIHSTLLDRFQIFRFKKYEEEEFNQIVQNYLWRDVWSLLKLNENKTLSKQIIKMLFERYDSYNIGLRPLKRLLFRLGLRIIRSKIEYNNIETGIIKKPQSPIVIDPALIEELDVEDSLQVENNLTL